MQTFVVLFLGISLGHKIALASIGLYLIEGIAGLPVFSNSPEKGVGLVYFTGPTMGYLIGFLTACYLASKIKIDDNFFIVLFKLIIATSTIYILALNATSLGLQLAGVPLESAVGAVRMSLINDNWVVQATNSELEESVFDMVVAGSLNNSGEVDIVMVEAGATDNALGMIEEGSTAPSENIVADGIDSSKEYIAKLIEAQKELVAKREVPQVDGSFS